MSDFNKTVNYATKDNLVTGDPAKLIKGAELNVEFNNLEVASASKANKLSSSATGKLIKASGTDIQDSGIIASQVPIMQFTTLETTMTANNSVVKLFIIQIPFI